MIAFVTGGTGFLGKRVVRCLCKNNFRVRCFVRDTSNVESLKAFLGNDLWQQVEIIRGDLNDQKTLRTAIEGVDVVYHLAAGTTGGAAALVTNTVIPTRVLARVCASAKIPRFVLISSLGVYGAGNLSRWSTLTETCPIDDHPQWRDAYSFSKIMQEEVCREVARDENLALVVVRPGVIIGPGRGALSTRVGLTVAGTTFRIGGTRLLPYTFVDNCASAIYRAGVAANVVGETFNILDDDLPSVNGLLSAYRRYGRKLRSVWLPQSAIGPLSSIYEWYHNYSDGQLPNVISRYRTETFWKPLSYSNRKAKTLLEWSPHVAMKDALETAISSPLAETP